MGVYGYGNGIDTDVASPQIAHDVSRSYIRQCTGARIGFGTGRHNINPGDTEGMGNRGRKRNRSRGKLVVLGNRAFEKGCHGGHGIGLAIGNGQIEIGNQVMGKYTASRAADNIEGRTMAGGNGVQVCEDFADARWQGHYDLGPRNGCVVYHIRII